MDAPGWFKRQNWAVRALVVLLTMGVLAGLGTVVVGRATGGGATNTSLAPVGQKDCDRLYSQYPTAHNPPPAVDLYRPVLGWNPYNTYSTKATQQVILATTVAMDHDGLRSARYSFVNLDDGWQGARDSHGNLTANARFGCGIGRLAQFVHGHGFDFGIYTAASGQSCGGLPGSGGHVQQDVNQFVRWRVDLIKLDWCGASYDPATARAIAQSWQNAIRKAGRPMVLMVNAGGAPAVVQQVAPVANSFRVEGDVCPSWSVTSSCPAPYHLGVRQYLRKVNWNGIRQLVRPGHFADADMLEIGNGIAYDEEQTQMSLWAMWSAPLIAGNNVSQMDAATARVLTNRRIIAVDQDRLARPATLIATVNGVQYWRKTVAGGVVIAVVNLTNQPISVPVETTLAELPGVRVVRDLWSGQKFASTGYYDTSLRPHAVRVLEFSARA